MTATPRAGVQILVVSHGFQPAYERGFCNGLAAVGHRVTLVSGDRADRSSLDPSIELIPLRGSQEECRPRWIKALNMLRYRLALLMRVVRSRPAVVHVIGLIEPLWVVGVLEGWLLRLMARRYVLTVHDLLPHDRHTAIARRACRLAYRAPHHLVVHTSRMAKELETGFAVDPTRVTVMAHGIEPSPKAGQASQVTSRNHPPRLLCFGHVMHYKGIDLLVDAMALVKAPCELLVSGACRNPRLARDLAVRIAESPVAARINWFAGFVSEVRMEELFLHSDVLVLPYRHIDQSGVLMQALRFGVPVVATRVGAFEETVTFEIGELCEPGDVPALATALDRLLARLHSIDRARIIEAGSLLAWSKVVQVLDEAYQDPSTSMPGVEADPCLRGRRGHD